MADSVNVVAYETGNVTSIIVNGHSAMLEREQVQVLISELQEAIEPESAYAKALRTGVRPPVWPPLSMTRAELEHFRQSAGVA